ncbi:MAG: PAS domain-containing protein [Deltaproteobacteria bacterium]|nr:PAS domain-containing protein [Deltaproteobacteria bacterium]
MFTYIIPVVTGLSGYSPAEIIGHSFTEFIHPEDLPALIESFQKTLAGQLEPSEFRVVTKSGAIRWARSSSRSILKGERSRSWAASFPSSCAPQRMNNHGSTQAMAW